MSDLSKLEPKTKGVQWPHAMVIKWWWPPDEISDLILLGCVMSRLITVVSGHSMFVAGQRVGNRKIATLCSSARNKWAWTPDSPSMAIKEYKEIL